MITFQTINQNNGKIRDWEFDTAEDFLREYYINYKKNLPCENTDELVDGIVDGEKQLLGDIHDFVEDVNVYYWCNYDKNEQTSGEIVIKFKEREDATYDFIDKEVRFGTLEEFMIAFWTNSDADMPETYKDTINEVYFNGRALGLSWIGIMDLVYIMSKIYWLQH